MQYGTNHFPQQEAVIETANGTKFVVRRLGYCDGPRLVLCHGNGFAMDGYEPFWRLLLERFDVILYDLRNHGKNPPSELKHHKLSTFVDDMETVYHGIQTEFGKKPSIGVFHSISAATALWHGLKFGKRWDALVLFDPPLIPPPGHRTHVLALEFELMLIDWSKSQLEIFSSPEELADIFANSYSFRRWVPDAYDLMANAILRHEPTDGKWHLCCPREAESQAYDTQSDTYLSDRFLQLPVPMKTICADPTELDAQAPSKVWHALHEDFGHDYEVIPGTSHMLIIEKPAACVAAIISFLEKLDLV